MHLKLIIIFLISGCLAVSCKKESGRHIEQGQPEINLFFEGTQEEHLANPDKNEHSMYSFGGVSGTYYGCTSSFKLKQKVSIDITLGTQRSTNLQISDDEFHQLIIPGERKFGSLGSFTSFPAMENGRVEIAFTDKKGGRWCSTRITERMTPRGIETQIMLDQFDGVFVIDDTHKIEIGPEKEGYRIKGHFDCYLYEVNGDAKRKIKGKFQGVVGVIAQ